MQRQRKGGPKRPVQKVETAVAKRPRAVQREGEGRPSWRFAQCDHDGPLRWSWDSFIEHHDKLMDIEGKPWNASVCDGNVGVKRIPLANLPVEGVAEKRLRKLDLDDTDALWEVRVGNKPRFWGIRTGDCFHFLWWDPKHEVFPRGEKRRTRR